HDERRIESAIALGDHDAFVGLDALPLAFHDADVHDDGIARSERGDCLAQPGELFLLECCDDIHAALSITVDRSRLRALRRAFPASDLPDASRNRRVSRTISAFF